MTKLSKKDLLLVGLMLFSLFFGAGNMIFPPFLGQAAGDQTWIAMSTFFITAVGFPILGVVAVAKSNGLTNLARRVNPIFASVFTLLIYLSIGPCLGIPRAGSLPFELVVAPYLPEAISSKLALFAFTSVFFAIAYWLSLSPSKLINRMGKILTPTLLCLILTIFIGSLFKPLGEYASATAEYITSPAVKGFLEGYLTMDTIAALNFGLVIAMAIKSKGITDEKAIVKTTIKAGCIAAILLIAVYSILAHLGASSGGHFGLTDNGAQTLNHVTTYVFGQSGALLLAVTFTLACLTTSVGLITSCSQYFASLSNKVSYKTWVKILAASSMLFANMGLTTILAVSVPVLVAIYPIAIVLIVFSMFDFLFKDKYLVYNITILFTGIVSVTESLSQAGFNLNFITKTFSKLPLYDQGLGWVLPALIGVLIGSILEFVCKNILSASKLENANL